MVKSKNHRSHSAPSLSKPCPSSASLASPDRPFQPYQIMGDGAVLAFHRGEFRQAADMYRQATLLNPNRWSDCRYHLFHGYTSILRGDCYITCLPNERDYRILRQDFCHNEQEAALFRAEAAVALAHLYWQHRKDYKQAATYYRSALKFLKTADESEKECQTFFNGVQRTVRQLLELCQTNAVVNLERLDKSPTNPPFISVIDPDGTIRYKRVHPEIFSVSEPEPDVQERLKDSGGGACDACGKTLEELGVDHLERCGRCMMAFYCSPACQKAKWRAGHKQACREPDQREPGDLMVLRNLQAKPELNGFLVQVMEPDPVTPGRYVVQTYLGDGRPFSVSGEKLEHIRPAK